MPTNNETKITIPELESFYEQLRLFSDEEREAAKTAWLPVVSGTPDIASDKPKRGRKR
jgi:hypothetical protein